MCTYDLISNAEVFQRIIVFLFPSVSKGEQEQGACENLCRCLLRRGAYHKNTPYDINKDL